MTELFDQLALGSVIADPRLPLAMGCALLAGLTRGFSGFGSALIYIPLMSALYGPQLAAGSLVLIDLAVDAMLLPGLWRRAQWREIWPLAGSAIVAGQFGTVILEHADPVMLRWVIGAIVLAVVGALASGWRYHGKPKLIVTLAVGAMSGLLGSSVQIAGPPVIMYWLGSAGDLAVLRANFIGYFTLLSAGLFGTYLWRGIITSEAVAIALFTGPVQVLATWLGAKLFHVASARMYRSVAYVVIAVVALVSLPLFDSLWGR